MLELRTLDMKKSPIEVIVEEPETDDITSTQSGEDDYNESGEPLSPNGEANIEEDGDEESESDDAISVTSRAHCLLKCVAITSSAVSVVLLCAVVVLAYHLGAVHYCTSSFTSPSQHPTGVFDEMTSDEYTAVRDYMLRKSKIGLTPIEQATPNSSYIYMIDLHAPLKAGVLEYIDRGSVRIKRAAKVVVVRGDLHSPRVEEYLVSPLPNPSVHVLPRNPSYARFPVPYTSRPTDQVDYRYLYEIITEFTRETYFILMESYGLCYHNCTHSVNCMIFRDVAPRGRESGDRDTWFRAFRDVEGFFLHPLGLEVQINHKSTDVSKWYVSRVAYNGQLLYTTKGFIERYKNGRLQKSTIQRPLGPRDQLYSSYHRRGINDMPTLQQGPRLFEPDGHRYKLTGNHVKYMPWDFDIHMRPSTGLQIFDIRFQSERIVYELSLQEGVMFSSGYGPTQSMSNIYLASWMIGASSFELVRGVDCPDTASFIGTTHFVNSGYPQFNRNTICVFEHNPGIPLRRHYESDQRGGYFRYGGMVDYQLIVRHIATVLSQDYIFDYVFHLNGEMEVRVSPTGYVETTFKLPYEKPYGNPLYYDVTANVHQHLFHYKIDLDIRRVENRYSVLEIDTEIGRHPWYPQVNRTQFVITEKEMHREMDVVVAETNKPNYHIIFDENPLNKFGSRRAYRILHKGDEVRFDLEDEDVTNAARWGKYPIVVTKYDDTEEQSSSIYAQNDPWDPVLDFERFVSDNDTIFNEDLVVWATLGLYHIPSTEDVPSTSTSWQTQSLHIVPYNFFTECPSVSSPNAVQIFPTMFKDGLEPYIDVISNGMSDDVTCAPPTYGPKVYYGFTEDVPDD